MMERQWKVNFTNGPMDLAGVLDMLRYDACTVIDWSHFPATKVNSDKWSVTFTTPLRVPTHERWGSFGLLVYEVRY